VLPATVIEAAAQLGVTPRRIRQLCEAGELQAQKAGRDWLIDRAALERFERQPPGRPPKEPE
jgi:excisionase family DNA binding protein